MSPDKKKSDYILNEYSGQTYEVPKKSGPKDALLKSIYDAVGSVTLGNAATVSNAVTYSGDSLVKTLASH